MPNRPLSGNSIAPTHSVAIGAQVAGNISNINHLQTDPQNNQKRKISQEKTTVVRQGGPTNLVQEEIDML